MAGLASKPEAVIAIAFNPLLGFGFRNYPDSPFDLRSNAATEMFDILDKNLPLRPGRVVYVKAP